MAPDSVRPVVTFGETMVLLTAPGTGPLRHASLLHVSVGGAESNVAIGLQRLGIGADWMGRVGDDEFGRRVLATLRGEAVGVEAATVDVDAPTGLMLKWVRAAGFTEVAYHRRGSAGSRLAPEHLDERRIRQARLLHVTGITAALSDSARRAVFAATEIARAARTAVCFDVNYRAALWDPGDAGQVCADIARRADVLLAGEDEARLLLSGEGAGDPAQLLSGLRRLTDGCDVIVKRGSEGAVACIEDDLHEVPPRRIAAVDPVGAGDGFAAGYIAGLLDGRPAGERLALAAATGAYATTVQGDWEGLPDRAELRRLDSAEDVTR